MPKRSTTNSSTRKTFFSFLLVTAGAIVLALVVYLWRFTAFDFRSDASVTGVDFIQAQGKDLVYRGVKVTLRGVNFDNISALGAGIGSNNIDNMSIGEADYKMLASLGGNHARLGLSYTWWEKDPNKFYQVLDNHVRWAKENGIWLTFLNFVNPDGNDGCYEGYGNSCSFWTNQAQQNQIQDFWIAVASRYANEPAVAGYDIVNEPTPPGPGWCNTWWDLAQKMRNNIAPKAPNQLIFIEACSDPSFARVFKEADGTKAKNVVYEVHDYDPMRITHTGYNAANTTAVYPGEASTWIDGTQKTLFFDKSTFEGTRYPEYSTAKQYSIEWAAKNDVPIYIGEWGAQGWAKGYVQFIRDKADVYNKLGVNHAYYTWKHQVTDGWRWGVFTRDATVFPFVSPEPEKLEAMKLSLANSFRPDFGTQVVTSSPVPTPVPTPVPSPVATPTLMPSPVSSPAVSPKPTPMPSPVGDPPTPVGYPKVLPGTNSKITLTEVKPSVDRKVFIKAEFDPSIAGYQVDWYINNRWTTSDKTAPFYLGGDSNGTPAGFPMPQGENKVRAVVYYQGQQFIDTTTTYTVQTVATATPSPVPSPVPVNPVTGVIDIFNEWNTGYCARLVVRNNSNKDVRSWKFYFNLNQAKFTSKNNGSFLNLLGRITVTPNNDIKYLPAFGMNNAVDYCATKKGNNWRPSNVSVSYTQ